MLRQPALIFCAESETGLKPAPILLPFRGTEGAALPRMREGYVVAPGHTAAPDELVEG
jgi:hypothetical protein